MKASDGWLIDQRPVRSINESDQRRLSRDRWPATLAPVRQLLDEGLDLGTGQLALVGQLAELAGDPRCQVLLATHSPILAAAPGVTLLQLTEEGMTPTEWEDLEVVDHYRRFLDGPLRYLRHVLP